jgi:hypothetical protein
LVRELPTLEISILVDTHVSGTWQCSCRFERQARSAQDSAPSTRHAAPGTKHPAPSTST